MLEVLYMFVWDREPADLPQFAEKLGDPDQRDDSYYSTLASLPRLRLGSGDWDAANAPGRDRVYPDPLLSWALESLSCGSCRQVFTLDYDQRGRIYGSWEFREEGEDVADRNDLAGFMNAHLDRPAFLLRGEDIRQFQDLE